MERKEFQTKNSNQLFALCNSRAPRSRDDGGESQKNLHIFATAYFALVMAAVAVTTSQTTEFNEKIDKFGEKIEKMAEFDQERRKSAILIRTSENSVGKCP